MSDGKKNGKTAKKRRRYGSFAWIDKKTGYLYARVRVKGADGSTRTVLKRAKNLTHVAQLADEIKFQHADRGDAYIDGERMTFQGLADWYKDKFVQPPVYVEGAKISGMRTWVTEAAKIDRIVEGIGADKLIREIDEDVIDTYRKKRLKSVGIATANRDMETIRRMLRKAKVKKWIKHVPDFSELHFKSLEKRREVTITDEEFERIAEAAKVQNHSPRLYALVLSLRDSGARPHELYPVSDYGADYSIEGDTKYFPLRWRDLFDENGDMVPVSVVTSTKGRQIQKRLLVVTERMAEALRSLWEYLSNAKKILPENSAHLDNLVFPHKSFQSAWEIVRVMAGVPELRLRDLRRDWVTRLARDGYSDRLAQQGAGHKRVQQTFEYTVFDYAAAMQAKAILDKQVIETDSVN